MIRGHVWALPNAKAKAFSDMNELTIEGRVHTGVPIVPEEEITALLAGHQAPPVFSEPLMVPRTLDDQQRNRAGAPPKYDLATVLSIAARLIYEGIIPKSQNDLARKCIDEYQKRLPGHEIPSDTWVKENIRKFWNIVGLKKAGQ